MRDFSIWLVMTGVLLFFISGCIDYNYWTTEPDEPAGVLLQKDAPENYDFTNSGIQGNYPAGSLVALHGKLKVIGTQLCDEYGSLIQLRGLSTMGLQWEGEFVNREGIAWMAENWKMDVLRLAMYTMENGYLNDKSIENLVRDAVQYTEECGIYCIVDWHILKDRDPNWYKKEARDFLKRMAFLYGAKKHVLYEICNEPNGIKWGSGIKPYAEYVIPAIRAGDSNAVIIVGTECWSWYPAHAAADPLKYGNIMYTVHFYAGNKPYQWMRERAEKALSNIALFCTEWGPCSGNGNGVPDLEEAKKWADFMNEKKISWCNWSFSDAPESSAFFKPGVKNSGGWQDFDLSVSGKFIRDLMTNR